MLLLLALLSLSPARAGSLDNFEVGGPGGSPTATDATAIWWNPAGIAAEGGTRIMVEGAPLIGKVQYTRNDQYGFGGTDTTRSFGVVPFLGVATDAGVKGLGLGLSVSVPVARGGAVQDEIPRLNQYPQDGPVPPESNFGRYHLREAKVQAMYVQLAAAYEIAERVSLGASVALVNSTWQSRLDTELVSALDASIEGQTGNDSGYTNAMVEDPRYGATLQFSPLKDTAFTFNGGLRAKVIPDLLSVGVAYTHGVRLDHKGDLTLNFSCPPQSDFIGRFASESLGLCYTTINAAGSVGYRLPSRVNASILVQPTPMLDVTLMGGWVGWSVFTDYEIGITDIAARNPDSDNAEGLAERLESPKKLRARAAEDSYWGGIDLKVHPTDWLTVGTRGVFDRAAIPDHAVSPNNYDANNLMISGLVAVKPVPWLQIGASYTHHILEPRVVTDSGWAVDVEGGTQREERWFYPHANGTYNGNISRLGLQVRVAFGAKDETKPPPVHDEPLLAIPVPAAPVEDPPVDPPATDEPASEDLLEERPADELLLDVVPEDAPPADEPAEVLPLLDLDDE